MTDLAQDPKVQKLLKAQLKTVLADVKEYLAERAGYHAEAGEKATAKLLRAYAKELSEQLKADHAS